MRDLASQAFVVSSVSDFDRDRAVHYGFADGLRAIAIYAIVIGHAASQVPPHVRVHGLNLLLPMKDLEPLPLTMLFVLSGFLLSRPFLAAIVNGNKVPSALEFWVRRALRIYPLYAFAVVAVALVDSLWERQKVTAADLITHLTFTHTLFESTTGSISIPFWTMAVDAQFYLLLPLLAVSAIALMRKKTVPERVAFIIAASVGILALTAIVRLVVLLKFHGRVGLYDEIMLLKNIWGMLGIFLLGTLVQLWTMFCSGQSDASRQRVARLAWKAALIFFVIHVAGTTLHVQGGGYYVTLRDKVWGALEDVIGGAGCALILLAFAAQPNAFWSRLLSSRIAVAFAALSYAVYLFHFSVLRVMAPAFRTWPANLGFATFVILATSVILPIAYVTHRTIEEPFLRLKGRLRTRVPATHAAQ